MWDGYLFAAAEFIEAHSEVKAKIVIDRFHVAKNYRDGFDQLRKQEFRRLRQELSQESYDEIVKGHHWTLRRNHAQLDEHSRTALRRLFGHSNALHQAYSLREELTAIFNLPLTIAQGKERINRWVTKVERSGVTCFDKFIKTVGNHFENIANYFHHRSSSGFVEGLNNKLKVVTRRSYGLTRNDSLFSRLWLDLCGYQRFCS